MHNTNHSNYQGQKGDPDNVCDYDDIDDIDWLGDLLDPWKGRNWYIGQEFNDSSVTRLGGLSHMEQVQEESIIDTQHPEMINSLDRIRNMMNSFQPHELSSEHQRDQNLLAPPNLNFFEWVDMQNERILNSNHLKNVSQEKNHVNEEDQLQENMSFSLVFNPLSRLLQKKVSSDLNQQRQRIKLDKTILIGVQESFEPESVERNQITEQNIIQNQEAESKSSQESEKDFLPLKRKIVRKNLKNLTKRRSRRIEKIMNLQLEKTKRKQIRKKRNESIKQKIRAKNLMIIQKQQLVDIKDSNEEPMNEEIQERPMEIQEEISQSHIQQDNHESNIHSEEEINGKTFPEFATKIIKNITERRLTPNQQRIAHEFESVIKIINDKHLTNDKIYRWELGTLRIWKNITEAINSNFNYFIRHSKKFKSKFLKFLPKNIDFKSENTSKTEKNLGESIKMDIKIERTQENTIKSKTKQLANLKEIFDKIQLTKVIQYEKIIKERDNINDFSEIDECSYTEYEPNSGIVEEMIQELVVRTNKKIQEKRSKRKTVQQPVICQANESDAKARHELVIHRLCKATEGYNYIDSINRIFALNKKEPSLSCLTSGGLGLRSNNLKVIDKATFEAEMNRFRKMENPIILNDVETNSFSPAGLKAEAERETRQSDE